MKSLKQNSYLRKVVLAFIAIQLLITAPALAHHPLDGRLPANFFEGIMSGFGHPVIGFDHLAFVIASGLLALKITGGILIPIAFVLATGIGAGIHLLSINLPIPEIVIAVSVVLFGILLTIKSQRKKNFNYGLKISGLAGLAGIFHGFAYGEGIFGAEPTPMFAYLIGFIMIQLVISLGIYFIANKARIIVSAKYLIPILGVAIVSTGIVFLSSALIA
ncbi:hydrogenase/urease accessory protein [Xenococcus sp. PCC 7305]|uniref:HupE/UreJ family protein n=1 Tax=Xenococcus sp. PCC 7305 TaxID=102125 RepID=UPI0002AD0755|nr:HupE/UreJ family protein [Xenococcus sp. PCC 7305]ELS02897.1 hydrogenase/urease accessory protein [Xenococcus sp. PCC 7305]